MCVSIRVRVKNDEKKTKLGEDGSRLPNLNTKLLMGPLLLLMLQIKTH